MPEVSTLAGFGIFCAIVGVGLYFMFGRGETVVFDNEHEQNLTNQLARRTGCSLSEGLDYIRREIAASPNQDDATILKRAEYHYRRNLPETGACGTYRGRSRG